MANLYILKNKDNKYYVGITKLEVSKRLNRHNKGDVKSTKENKPWKIIYTENFVSMDKARKREKEIKSWKGGNTFKKLIYNQSCGIV